MRYQTTNITKDIIGNRYINKKGEEYEVLEFAGYYVKGRTRSAKFLIRFIATDFVKEDYRYRIIKGESSDTSKKITRSTVSIVGETYINTQGLEYKVLEKTPNSLYTIRFTETNYVKKNCTKYAIVNGHIIDRIHKINERKSIVYTNKKGQEYIMMNTYIRNNTHICSIKFLASGNVYDVTYSGAKLGTVLDRKLLLQQKLV